MVSAESPLQSDDESSRQAVPRLNDLIKCLLSKGTLIPWTVGIDIPSSFSIKK